MLAVSMPNSATFAAFAETATKMPGDSPGIAADSLQQPVARALCVGHRSGMIRWAKTLPGSTPH